jgi:hypothetical protein
VLALFALLIALDPAGAQEASAKPEHHLVDMVVAQVDSTVITFSELVAETRLVLLKTGGAELARAGNLSESLFSAVLRSMVVRELVLGEVRRLKLRDVPDTEIKGALDALRRRFVTAADFERFLEKSGFSEPGARRSGDLDAPPSLIAIVTADLEVERFLDVRVRRNIIVRESEVVACHDANAALFRDRSTEEARAEIRTRLEDQQRERALLSLISTLEKRAAIRYTPGFEPPAPTRPGDSGGLQCPETKTRPAIDAP